MITISRAKISESQKVRRLEQTVWKSNIITSQYDAAFFVHYGHVFVAKDKNKIVGAIVAIKTKGNEIKIIDWVVAELYRRHGVGLRLYQALKKAAGKLPLIAWVKTTNHPSLEAHRKLGFKKTKKLVDPFALGNKGVYWIMKKV